MAHKPLILLIDDESHIINVLALYLVGEGFAVISADNSRRGLELASTQRPDAVIADYWMPPMHGIELARRLAEDPGTAAVPVLLLTARNLPDETQALQETNIRGVIAKPFSLMAIARQLRGLLDGRAVGRGVAA